MQRYIEHGDAGLMHPICTISHEYSFRSRRFLGFIFRFCHPQFLMVLLRQYDKQILSSPNGGY